MIEEAFQRRIQRYGWDKAAPYYESTWQNQLQPAHAQMFELAKIQQGEKILDTACGTGLTSFVAAELTGPSGYVLGTDLSEKMVESCQKTAARKAIMHSQFQQMDSELLTLSDTDFDLALCGLGLMYMPNPIKALEEMQRTLKPGGRCVVSVWGQRSNCGWADVFKIVDQHVVSKVCPMFFQLGNEGALQKSLELAGFKDVEVKRISTHLHYSCGKEACSAAFEGGPVALAYFKFPFTIQKEVYAEYLTSIAAYQNGTCYAVPGEFVIAIGRK